MTDFTEAVATRAGVPVAEVRSILADAGIVPQPTAAAPVSLHVERVRFGGVKRRRDHEDQEFDFDRTFSAGLWAITSEIANLAGKSTVLFVIRWALTGRSHLNDDVRSWIRDVQVTGSVADEPFEVQLTCTPTSIEGRLLARDVEQATFDTETAFEEVLDDFFLNRLRLDPTPFWQRRTGGQAEEGDRRRHGWQSYFPALHLRAENLSMLLGDQPLGGQPATLLQVFLGVPWALTFASARTAERALTHERSAARRRAEEDTAARQRSQDPLRHQHGRLIEQLEALRRDHAPFSAGEVDRRRERFAAALRAEREAQDSLVSAEAAIAAAQEDADEVRKRLDAVEQSQVIRPLLGRLLPTVCPRCDTSIAVERRARESQEHECSVCAEPLPVSEDHDTELDRLREETQAADEALRQVVRASRRAPGGNEHRR
jgi:hypothetical protein